MEPVTYFLTVGTQIVFMGYYLMTQREYNYETLASRKELKAFYKVGRGWDPHPHTP